jgi:hypothetical protein
MPVEVPVKRHRRRSGGNHASQHEQQQNPHIARENIGHLAFFPDHVVASAERDLAVPFMEQTDEKPHECKWQGKDGMGKFDEGQVILNGCHAR